MHLLFRERSKAITMDPSIRELLSAESRGRALVQLVVPGPGEHWEVDAVDDADGRALLAAARWATRLGAAVQVRWQDRDGASRAGSVLAESARKQGLLTATAPARGNALRIPDRHGGVEPVIPDPSAVWRMRLADIGTTVATVDPDDDSLRGLTCAQSREIDRAAMRDFSVPGICLMENAAIGAVAVAMDMLPPFPSGVAVVAGGGNNGGDGLAVARGMSILGIRAEVALLKAPETLTGDAAVNLDLLREIPGISIHDLHDRPQDIDSVLEGKILVVDALLGTGFKGRLAPAFLEAITRINASGLPILSLDLPSGLDGDTGDAAVAVAATRTVTFAAVKRGMLRGTAPMFVGDPIHLADIGAPTAAFPAIRETGFRVE